MTSQQEALARIAALCDEQRPWDENDADSAEARSARSYNSALAKVRAILAEVTPETGGTLDRDQARVVLAKQPGINRMPGAYIEAVLDRLSGCVRPLKGGA